MGFHFFYTNYPQKTTVFCSRQRRLVFALILKKGFSFSRLFSSLERFLGERDFKGGSEKGRPRRPESSLALKPSIKDKIKNGLNTPIFLCRVKGQSSYFTANSPEVPRYSTLRWEKMRILH